MNFAEMRFPSETVNEKTGYDMRDLMAPVDLPVDLDLIWKSNMRHFAFKGPMSKMARCSVCGKYIDLDKAVHRKVENPWYQQYIPCGYHREDIKTEGKPFRDGVFCDGCKSLLMVYPYRKNTDWCRLYENAKVQMLNVVGDRVLLQKFFLTRNINPETKLERIEAEEYLRYILIGDQVIYISKGHLWLGVYTWAKHGIEMTAGIEESPRQSIAGAAARFSRIPSLKYTMIADSIIQRLNETNDDYYSAQTAFEEICFAAAHPWVEFVWKMGLHDFYRDIVSGKANRSLVTPGIIRKNAKLLRKSNANYDIFYCIRKYQRMKAEVPDPEILKIMADMGTNLPELFISLESVKDYEYLVKQLKQGVSAHTFDLHYPDYRSMIKRLNKDAEIPEYLLYPKDLEKAHDEASRRINELRMAEENKRWGKIVKRLVKFEYVNADFGLAIVAPKKATDLTYEGSILHHCVGGYVDQVLQGYTTILFLRKVEDLNTPLGTIEFNNGRVVQCRGFHNQNDKLPPNYQDFLADWQKHLKQQQANA